MDTYENDDLNMEPAQENPSSVEPVSENESFYHGAGAGVVESTCGDAPPSEEAEPASETQETASAAQEPSPAMKRPKTWKKVCRRVGAGVLALVIVAGGSVGSAVLMNGYWKHQNQVLQKSFNERISVLQEQLEEYQNQKNTVVAVSETGLTPAQIYEMNIQSIVAIECTTHVTENGQSYQATSAGSGFILTSDGYVVTNHHVVDGATTIHVVDESGSSMDATLVGSDDVNDIAVLKVAAENLQPVTIGSSSALKVGDRVVAIGNALGELSFSLTVGYISGIDRDVNTDGFSVSMIQTDASINSGNSGGPLFNAKGEVVGITSAKYSGTTSSGASIEGIGFAIPMDDVIGMLEDLKDYGYIRSAYLGVTVRDVDSTVHQMYGLPMGAYVDSVTFGGAAHRAGLQARDIIVRVGGYDVKSLSDLTRVLRNFEPGQEATITVWRAGKEIVLTIVFDEKPQA